MPTETLAETARREAALRRLLWRGAEPGEDNREYHLMMADLLDALAEKAETMDGLDAALPSSDGFCLFVAPDGGREVRSGLDGCELGTGPDIAAAVADALAAQDTPGAASEV